MKTIFRFIIAAMAAISVFSSCQKELANETVNNATDGVRTISVQFDNSTKACFDGLTPKFENDDQIRVSNDTESEVRTVSVDGSGNATFTTTLSGTLTAIYPADAAVLGSGEGQPIVSPYFKVLASQNGKAIIAKASIETGSSSATFTGQTAVFEITPPTGATTVIITSLKQIGTDGQRSGTAVAINTEGVDDAAKCKITVNVPTGGTAYVSLVSGVNLTDLSFDAGATYGMKGIPMKDITAAEKTNATAANTKYTIGNSNNTWHPYVEIQVNSKTYKWATMNIGASSEADYGYYFFWGGIVGYVRSGSDWVMASNTSSVLSGGFSQNNDPHYDNTNSKYTKYTGEDNKPVLELADDAATVNWGGSWRMPTKAEFDAVCSLGEWESDYNNSGVNGYLLKSGDKELIFFPAAGYGNGAGLDYVGDFGSYWSSSLSTSYPDLAYYLYFFAGGAYTQIDYGYRYYGQSVRALSE